MNMTHVFTASTLGLAMTLIAPLSSVQAKEPAHPAGVIEVYVTIPATPSPTAEFNVGERFVDDMANAFRNWGFHGKVKRLERLDQPTSGAAVLRVNLTEWDRDATGNFTCRFSATLKADGQERNLGTYDGTSPGMLTAPGGFGASEAFDKSATDALHRLYDDLAKTDLIVGLKPR